jgi:phospholipid/cholesterol/gamma-HCH transport system ATP-binding protein
VRRRLQSVRPHRVFDGLNLGIPEGKITVVPGPSETGKTVLIKHLLGLMFPDSGDVRVQGRSVPNVRKSELLGLRRRFGVLFQDGALFGSMNLYDNVAFPLRQHTDLSESEIHEIVVRRLGEAGLGAPRTGCPTSCPAACARGRVALARWWSIRRS